MTTAGGGSKKKSKFEYVADIYDEHKLTVELMWEQIANKEAIRLDIEDFDLRPFAAELFSQQLPQFIALTKLNLVNCNLDSFAPAGLGKIENINLMGNQIPHLNLITLSDKTSAQLTADEGKGRLVIPESNLKKLNMSDNLLESFPFIAVQNMTNLKEVDLSRNRIAQILDEGERSQIVGNKYRKMPLSKFTFLCKIDLSSNLLTRFPEELKDLKKLRELNLMNNSIETIPSSFFMASEIQSHLKRFVLNQNPLRDLDPKVEYLGKLKVLGIAATNITKLPPNITKLKLKEIYVSGTPLKTPKLALAMRGFGAIKEFFKQNEDENDEDVEEEKGINRNDTKAKSTKKIDPVTMSKISVAGANEEQKVDGLADELHVLNEEFAQAIIFKRNELMAERANESSRTNTVFNPSPDDEKEIQT